MIFRALLCIQVAFILLIFIIHNYKEKEVLFNNYEEVLKMEIEEEKGRFENAYLNASWNTRKDAVQKNELEKLIELNERSDQWYNKLTSNTFNSYDFDQILNIEKELMDYAHEVNQQKNDFNSKVAMEKFMPSQKECFIQSLERILEIKRSINDMVFDLGYRCSHLEYPPEWVFEESDGLVKIYLGNYLNDYPSHHNNRIYINGERRMDLHGNHTIKWIAKNHGPQELEVRLGDGIYSSSTTFLYNVQN